MQDGVGFVKQAVELDKNKKFEEAIKYYDLAVYFLKVACNGKLKLIFVLKLLFFHIFVLFLMCGVI